MRAAGLVMFTLAMWAAAMAGVYAGAQHRWGLALTAAGVFLVILGCQMRWLRQRR